MCNANIHDRLTRRVAGHSAAGPLSVRSSIGQAASHSATIQNFVAYLLLFSCLQTPRYGPSGTLVDEGAPWPFWLFSHDSSYLAMRREKDIVIYELPSMTILEEPLKPDVATERLRTPLSYPLEMFQWSPGANLLSVWLGDSGDKPGRLVLVDIPSRQEIATKAVYNVKHAWMNWQHKGAFLALRTVITRKKGKKSKMEMTQIEIFRLKEKSIPVDTVNVEGATVQDLHWEKGPVGSRFATVEVEDFPQQKRMINFYQVPVKSSQRDTDLVATLPVTNNVNLFAWSPAGQFFVAASKSDGAILFGCLNDHNKIEIFSKDEHEYVTDLMYDPSGRYVATVCAINESEAYRVSSSFRIYSFLGQAQYKMDKGTCSQFLWRPRPTTLLTAKKLEDVHKRIKEYSKRSE